MNFITPLKLLHIQISSGLPNYRRAGWYDVITPAKGAGVM